MKKRTIVMAVVLVLLAAPGALCAQGGLQPGDSIGEMSLRVSGSEGPPIWAFCVPAFLNPGVTSTACTVPPLPELAIGHGWYSADEDLRDSNWLAMSWQLFLDGQQVDLDAFGTYDADLPQTGLPGHDPDEEVITKLRSWDVVLVNPTPDDHILRSILTVSEAVDDGFHVTEADTYELVVSFAVEAPVPAVMPLTGGATPTGLAPLWIGLCGLLVLALRAGLRRLVRHT